MSNIDPYVGGGVIAVIAAVIGLWVRGSRARAQVSTDTLQVHENQSQGTWITALEKKLIAETGLRLSAEERERASREAHLTDMLENSELKALVRALEKKVGQLERRMSLVSELLIIERPDLASVAELLRSSEFVQPDLTPRR